MWREVRKVRFIEKVMAVIQIGETKYSVTAIVRQVQEDFIALTKARLSAMVVVTTGFGYLLATRFTDQFSWIVLFHLIFGTSLAAGGAAVFNELMEVDADAKMPRTADRPLPSGRLPRPAAFAMGWIFASFGMVHLAIKVNPAASAAAAATLVAYLFIYTPLKRISPINTLAGAVAGAFPPLIGWGGGGMSWIAPGGIFLFGLLFFWQLPHFAAINWIYRDQYVRGGFQMWANNDATGRKTGKLALGYSLGLLAFTVIFPLLSGIMAWWSALLGALLGARFVTLSHRFYRGGDRRDARKLFVYSLLYLPLELLIAYFAWTVKSSTSI